MTIVKGWNAKVFKGGIEIGKVRELRIDIDHSLELYFEAGNREAAMIIEGPINITGRMVKGWIDKNYLSLLTNTGELDSFTLALDVADSSMILYLYNCKFRKGALAIPQDGILTEDYDFLATSFSLV